MIDDVNDGKSSMAVVMIILSKDQHSSVLAGRYTRGASAFGMHPDRRGLTSTGSGSP